MNVNRIKKLNSISPKAGPVIYWMRRDQRIQDNWALIRAYQLAKSSKSPLLILFRLVKSYKNATLRQYKFMLDGLKEVERDALRLNIPFNIVTGEPVAQFAKKLKASVVVTDYSPLTDQGTMDLITRSLTKNDIAFELVDAHNIVPVWETSDKEEYAARTIRPKVDKKLPEYLTEFPTLKKYPHNSKVSSKVDWNSLLSWIDVKPEKHTQELFKPGRKEALKVLNRFIDKRLSSYHENSNDPNANVISDLSPYLHFGQISAQRVALEVNKVRKRYPEAVEAYLEQVIVRRELAENFCHYNKAYQSLKGCKGWAKKTLDEHRSDKREYLYTLKEFEEGNTHDPLWNGAQLEMVRTGKMHSYMRMYWCKKILEWSKTPEAAVETAIYLNDKYQLDGRDPNGYVGILWSIGGVHDRAWSERSVYGKIRYMNYNGAKRKFDVEKYIDQFIDHKGKEA